MRSNLGLVVPVLDDAPSQSDNGWKDVKLFRREMLDLEGHCIDNPFNDQRLQMRLNEGWQFRRACECYMCQRQMNEGKVRANNQLSGLYRVAVYERWNLMLRMTKRCRFSSITSASEWTLSVGNSYLHGIDLSITGNGSQKDLMLGWDENVVYLEIERSQFFN